MRFLNLFIFLTYFLHTIAFFRPAIIKHNLIPIKATFEMLDDQSTLYAANSKTTINSFLALIRAENILPTFLLSVAGGWLANPSFYNLVRCKEFYAGIAVTLLVLSNSMILNDVFDIEIDKINHKKRPLITGEIKVSTAKRLAASLFFLSEAISLLYLPTNLQLSTLFANILVLVYTPILKPIFLIKNISCAFLVSFAVFFSGFAANSNLSLLPRLNFELLSIASQMVFFGSLSNEILLDMKDLNGDRKNNIITVPGYIGYDATYAVLNTIAEFNILWSTYNLISLVGFFQGIPLLFMSSSLMDSIEKLKRKGYTKTNIQEVVSKSIKPMVLSLLYLCFNARI